MPNYNRLPHPVLEAAIAGAAGARPSSFTLITDRGFPSIVANLRYPQETQNGKPGDPVTVHLSLGGEKYLLFTGEIYSTGTHGAYRDFALTDGYKKLCDTGIAAAYRKETARVILKDALDAAGITKTAVTCPAVEIGRFSTEKIKADMRVKHLIKALEEHGHRGLRFFFDAEDVFHFGTEADTGKNDGAVFAFETGKNILKKREGVIEVLPLPIRHSQAVTVDGVEMITARTDLTVAGSRSRLILWLEAA